MAKRRKPAQLTPRSVSFVVLGQPVPQGSVKGFPIKRAGGTIGVSLTSDNAKLRPWRQDVKYEAMRHWKGGPSESAIDVTLTFCLQRKKSVKRELPTTKPDIDKLLRAVLDALTGIIYCDDSQVCRVRMQKHYAASAIPSVSITIEEIHAPAPDFSEDQPWEECIGCGKGTSRICVECLEPVCPGCACSCRPKETQ